MTAVSITLSAEEIARLFPAYMRTDHSGCIIECGPSLHDHIGENLVGIPLLDAFDVVRPLDVGTTQMFLANDRPFLLKHKRQQKIQLRGTRLERNGSHTLLTGHLPDSIGDGEGPKYQFKDFAPFDGTQDIFLAAQLHKGLLEDTQKLVEKLKVEKLAAESANIAKSNFLACMSHEIRTPLNGILGFTSLLANMKMTDQQADMLRTIHESGNSLLSILNDILDLSKVDAGKLDLEASQFSVDDIIRGIEKVYALKSQESGIAFELECPAPLRHSYFISDPHRIKQILNNLVSNAIKFTEKGFVKVQISHTPHTDPGRRNLRLRVVDSGIGIDDQVLKTLFTPFRQADSSMSRRFGGTGLGLSISKQLCELMGGTISASSKLSQGSTFEVSLPVQVAGRRNHSNSITHAQREPLRPAKILIAEDHEVNQKVISAMLTALGHDFTIVENGSEAVDLCLRDRFDLIFMDIQMPVIDGIEATRRIREAEKANRLRKTPIVAFTANAMKDDIAGYLSSGFDFHMAKPINLDMLVELIEKILPHALTPARHAQGS